MKYIIKPMDRFAALDVAGWKYPQPYAIYNMDAEEETMNEILGGAFYSVCLDRELVGYFCFGYSAQIPWAVEHGFYPPGFTDIGLAMRPDLTGKGLGLSFLNQSLEFARKNFDRRIRLTVAAFNQRAQKVYRRAGFKTAGGFTVPGGNEFLIMIQS